MIYFWAQTNWRQKCLYQDDKLLRQKCINHENIMDVLMAREPILPFRTIRRLLVNNNREIIFREAEPCLFTKVFKYSFLCLPWLQVFMAPPPKLCPENHFQLQAKWDKWRVTDYMRFGWNCIVIIMIISLSSSSSSWSSLSCSWSSSSCLDDDYQPSEKSHWTVCGSGRDLGWVLLAY